MMFPPTAMACPLVLSEKMAIENLGLISLLYQNQLRGEGGRKVREYIVRE